MRTIIFLFLVHVIFKLHGQEVLNLPTSFFPNETDSNNFYCYANVSYVLPFQETTSFQKSNLGPGTAEGNRVFQGELEMLFFTSLKYKNRIEPHVFFRVESFPMQYLGSKFGLGVSDRKLHSSLGVFVGQYMRRVPYTSNFITRRKRTFEHFPLVGAYLQSSSDEASFFFSVSSEKKNLFYSTRVAGRIGNMLSLGKTNSSPLKRLEVVMHFENYTGFGVGLATILPTNTRLEALWITPDKKEQELEARLRNKLSQGVLISVSQYVN